MLQSKQELDKRDKTMLRALPVYISDALIAYRDEVMEHDPRPITCRAIVEAALRTFWGGGPFPGQFTPADLKATETLRRHNR